MLRPNKNHYIIEGLVNKTLDNLSRKKPNTIKKWYDDEALIALCLTLVFLLVILFYLIIKVNSNEMSDKELERFFSKFDKKYEN